jgi:hypothetical protein
MRRSVAFEPIGDDTTDAFPAEITGKVREAEVWPSPYKKVGDACGSMSAHGPTRPLYCARRWAGRPSEPAATAPTAPSWPYSGRCPSNTGPGRSGWQQPTMTRSGSLREPYIYMNVYLLRRGRDAKTALNLG